MSPFERAYYPPEMLDPARLVRDHGITLEEAQDAVERLARCDVYRNDEFEVAVDMLLSRVGQRMIHLSIKRLDREPIHDWRKLQQIKNELVGPEHEAVELYPAESRLVDSANQYHLWVMKDPRWRFPFGYIERLVMDNPGGNAKQRPHNKGTNQC